MINIQDIEIVIPDVYTFIENNNICAYCGEKQYCHDHFLPISVQKVLKPILYTKNAEFLIPSCYECNSLVACIPFATVSHKIAHVSKIYENRSVSNSQFWTDEQKSSFAYRALWSIASNPNIKELIKIRLDLPKLGTPECNYLIEQVLGTPMPIIVKKSIIRGLTQFSTTISCAFKVRFNSNPKRKVYQQLTDPKFPLYASPPLCYHAPEAI